MSASTSQSEDGVEVEKVKVEKGPEGELKKTILSTMTSSSAETTTRKEDVKSTSRGPESDKSISRGPESDKSTFRGPDSGKKKYSVDELKKLKVTLEMKKRKHAATTSGAAAIDPSCITPVRRPDQVSAKVKEPSSVIAEDVGVSSEGLVNIAESRYELVIEDLKIPFPVKRKYLSESLDFHHGSKRQRKDERYEKEYDAVGYAMSKKLLRMGSTQAIYAESLMNKILEMGLLEELTSFTSIKNDRR